MEKTQWKGINNIIERKSANAKPINLVNTFNFGNTVTSDLIAISNIFNRHFASVGPKLAKKNFLLFTHLTSTFLVKLNHLTHHLFITLLLQRKSNLKLLASLKINPTVRVFMSFATPEMFNECHKWTLGQNHKILHCEWSISFQAKNGLDRCSLQSR